MMVQAEQTVQTEPQDSFATLHPEETFSGCFHIPIKTPRNTRIKLMLLP